MGRVGEVVTEESKNKQKKKKKRIKHSEQRTKGLTKMGKATAEERIMVGGATAKGRTELCSWGQTRPGQPQREVRKVCRVEFWGSKFTF